MTKAASKPPPATDLCETDFFAWTRAQAELPRARRFAELDREHLIDESYRAGRVAAARETGTDVGLFPDQAPFTIAQVLDPDHLPPEPGRVAP